MAAADSNSPKRDLPGPAAEGPLDVRVPLPGQPGSTPAKASAPPVASASAPAQKRTPGDRPLPVGRPIASPGARAASAGPVPAEDEEEPETLWRVIVDSSPAWLTSAVFHMVVLIILAMIAVGQSRSNQVELLVENVYAEQVGNQLEFDSPLGRDDSDKVETPIITPSNLKPVDDPFAAPPKADVRFEGGLTAASVEYRAGPIGLALSGRQEGSKQNLLGRYGGTEATESAVLRGLEWLKRNQLKDGSWSLKGPYVGGIGYADADNVEAATAMALLAFQGAGNTHIAGKFKSEVTRGWDFLLKRQSGDGDFYRGGGFNHRYYTQGQCTIALCELFAMTRDPKLKRPAERAIEFCVKGQGTEGGWRYSPNADSDVSVTGWIVMALQSAKMADLPVPSDTLQRVMKYLDTVGVSNGERYSYQPGHMPTVAMTAEALLCRMYLGWKQDDPRLRAGAAWIVQPENLITFRNTARKNVYYWYYATQVCHHLEGEYWKKWNDVMRQAVPERQVKAGLEKGSWDPKDDEWAGSAGRLYTTCLSLYMLEVYYRHMPLYGKVYAGAGGAAPAASAMPSDQPKGDGEPKPAVTPLP